MCMGGFLFFRMPVLLKGADSRHALPFLTRVLNFFS